MKLLKDKTRVELLYDALRNPTGSQMNKVLYHLYEHHAITPMTAMRVYGIYRLASRIADLKFLGFDIVNLERYGKTARYAFTNRQLAALMSELAMHIQHLKQDMD